MACYAEMATAVMGAPRTKTFSNDKDKGIDRVGLSG